MDRVARLPQEERNAVFSEAAADKRTTPAIIEKDFWVTWLLARLFQDPDLSKLLIFKGGTSLSKVYHLIERFSEDIDLILDWRVLTDEDPLAERSKRKQNEFNRQLDEQAKAYIGGHLFVRLIEVTGGVCACEIDADDAHIINVRYPAAFSDQYLRPELRLEIGPQGARSLAATHATITTSLKWRTQQSKTPRWRTSSCWKASCSSRSISSRAAGHATILRSLEQCAWCPEDMCLRPYRPTTPPWAT